MPAQNAYVIGHYAVKETEVVEIVEVEEEEEEEGEEEQDG